MSGLGAILSVLRGDAEADRVVPPGGAVAQLTIAGTAAAACLAAFALCLALAAARLAETWEGAVARSATVEIRVEPGEGAERLAARALEVLETTPGVISARRLELTDIARLLAPWAGEGADLEGVPLPVLIAVEEAPGFDPESLLLRLEGELPEARYDRHEVWRDRILAAAGRVRLMAMAGTGLSFAVLFVVVALAVRVSLAVNRGVIETLRGLGARDSYVARAFVRRVTLRALTGTAAGVVLAGVIVIALGAVQDIGLPGGLRPAGAGGWLLLAVIVPMAGAIAFATTRRAVYHALYRLT